MNTKELLYFCAAYEERNISHAANKMFISPQGLSKIIQRLEQELEIKLFIRSNSGISPTSYADSLYKNSKNIIKQLENIKKGITSEGAQNTYELIVASTLGVIDYLTPDFILDFNEQYPDVRLSIIQNADIRVDEMLRSDAAELGIISGPIDTTIYHARPFTTHRHCLVINETHPLAQKDAITYQDLDGVPLALEGREFCPFHNNMNRFLRAGVQPHIVLETTEIVSAHMFASKNKGIGISVDFPAFTHPCPNTVIRPFKDPNCTWETYFVSKKGKLLSPEADLFYEYSYRWLNEHHEQLFHWNI